MYTLPRTYLSYSAASTWWKSKQGFRNIYYLNKPKVDNVYTIFGKELSEKLQNNDPLYDGIPRFDIYEERISLEVDGVPILSYVDCFDEGTKAFVEHKTGIRKPDGSPRWTLSDVAAHEQLPWYSLAIKEKYGRVQNKCRLVWMETAWTSVGHGIGQTNKLEYTGHFEVFDRTIAEWERKRMRKLIVQTAQEISDDYTAWKRNN